MMPPPDKFAPRLTRAPWVGFSAREHKRLIPLPRCPHARCKRLKQCVGAHDELYCQRTHVSHAEFMAAQQRVAPLEDGEDLDFRQSRILEAIQDRSAAFEAMTQRWKAGEFDRLYGKYKACGVVVKPPPRAYVEAGRTTRRAKPKSQTATTTGATTTNIISPTPK